MNSEEIENMTVVSLRKELKVRNLPTSGNKGELAQRLMEHLANEEKSILQTSGFSVDEILDVPEEVVLGIATADPNVEIKAAKTETPVATTKPTTQPAKPLQPATKKSISDSPVVQTPSHTTVTKVSTHVSITAPAAPTDTKAATELSQKEEAAKIIPVIAPMSESERKMLRAKKFNVPLAQTKETRAERFGLSKTKDSAGKTGGTKISTVEQNTAKKQRAERFGLASTEKKEVATVPKGNQDETSKLIERARRFGLDESQTAQNKIVLKAADSGKNLYDALGKRKQRFGTETGKVDSGASAAKKMLRAQRFGLKF